MACGYAETRTGAPYTMIELPTRPWEAEQGQDKRTRVNSVDVNETHSSVRPCIYTKQVLFLRPSSLLAPPSLFPTSCISVICSFNWMWNVVLNGYLGISLSKGVTVLEKCSPDSSFLCFLWNIWTVAAELEKGNVIFTWWLKPGIGSSREWQHRSEISSNFLVLLLANPSSYLERPLVILCHGWGAWSSEEGSCWSKDVVSLWQSQG